MKLDFQTYRDKVMGCWAGKNIGGVLGAPFEGKRQLNEVDFYTQDLTMGPPPNDDLDLQIVFLAAVERYGRNVNASILGEYWLSYIIPNWVEYGQGKANLRCGLTPPMSGYVDNEYRNSCGCFIRSELWACLCPGQPELAARYAYEDGIVDHAGEGVYGEVFFAAMQSAAFVESDPQALLRVGLSYIPADCAVARAVRQAMDCHRQGVSLPEARRRIHNAAPGTFGIQGVALDELPQAGNEGMEIGAPGFDAPENVAFAVAGWLYGQGDFGQSLCAANAFGEDTDCTCASLGATLGIVLGASRLPERWTAPLGDQIATLCIDKTSGGVWVPKTVTELTERVLRVTPLFLGVELCDLLAPGGYAILCREGEGLLAREGDRYLPRINGGGKDQRLTAAQKCALSPFVTIHEFPAFTVYVDRMGSASFRQGQPRSFRVRVVSSHTQCRQEWVRIRLFLPKGVCADSAEELLLPLNNLWKAYAEAVFTVNADELTAAKLECLVDVSLEGRHSNGQVKLVLYREA